MLVQVDARYWVLGSHEAERDRGISEAFQNDKQVDKGQGRTGQVEMDDQD